MTWQPSASISCLKRRAELLKKARLFFYNRHYTEVETPCISKHTVTDRYIESIEVHYQGEPYYLQTSPEYFMKRLLAAGSGPIFQICKAFRHEEKGRFHNPEFTMLEWYHPGWSHLELMNEMSEFLTFCLNTAPADVISYESLFQHHFNINPHTATIHELAELTKEHMNLNSNEHLDKDSFLQLLMSDCIEPHLGLHKPTIVYDYPASQAALAKIKFNDHYSVAERFEVYLSGQELANGFHELTDPKEQENRFQQDQADRKLDNKKLIDIDRKLIACLEKLPSCAGVALGFDRLCMIEHKTKHIKENISFSWDHL